MKIALIGGTGNIGMGFALRWANKHEIFIGSRKTTKAQEIVEKYLSILKQHGINGNIYGMDNKSAAENAEIVVLTIPYKFVISTLEQIKNVLNDQIIVSVVVPMIKMDYDFIYTPPKEGCSALEIQQYLLQKKIVSAFHTIPAKKLSNLNEVLDYDVVICGDFAEEKQIISDLVSSIKNLRPLDGGPLRNSCLIESLTPLLINIAHYNNLKDIGIKFI
ncbi:MAG TPA: NADPH-dependent F420 reductase [Methanosarcinales archaeon]|nr:NADPH-dependent F420 reductase [Methanosarcinales archaeon]